MINDQLEMSEVRPSTQAVEYGVKKRRIVVMLLAYSGIFGVISSFVPEDDYALNFVVALPLLILGISWCFTDADERAYRIGGLTKLALIFLFIVGLPIYLLQTRGIRAFRTFAFAVLLIGGMFTCMFATAYGTLFLGDATGLWKLAE